MPAGGREGEAWALLLDPCSVLGFLDPPEPSRPKPKPLAKGKLLAPEVRLRLLLGGPHRGVCCRGAGAGWPPVGRFWASLMLTETLYQEITCGTHVP